MTPASPAGPAAAKGFGRTRSFRKHDASPRLTREQEQRQHHVLQSAWQHFGTAGPVIAFLNARSEALQGQPLHLAVQSEDGLRQVRQLLGTMTRQA